MRAALLFFALCVAHQASADDLDERRKEVELEAREDRIPAADAARELKAIDREQEKRRIAIASEQHTNRVTARIACEKTRPFMLFYAQQRIIELVADRKGYERLLEHENKIGEVSGAVNLAVLR